MQRTSAGTLRLRILCSFEFDEWSTGVAVSRSEQAHVIDSILDTIQFDRRSIDSVLLREIEKQIRQRGLRPVKLDSYSSIIGRGYGGAFIREANKPRRPAKKPQPIPSSNGYFHSFEVLSYS